MSGKRANKNGINHKRYYKSDEAIRNFVADDHIMSQCLEYIRDILRSENHRGKYCPFNEEIALNLDKVEILQKQKSGAERESTVDFVVCLENDWLLLVEAKLDVDNVDNIRKDIYDKIAHSKMMLQSCDNYCHMEDVVVVLLKDKDFQERYNRLRRQLIAKNFNVKPFRVCDFYNEYFVV